MSRGDIPCTPALLLLVVVLAAVSVVADNFIVMHPFYTGSHVLACHHITQKLISR